MEVRLGDVVRLKKKHPCGSDEWRVVRLGADIGIKCVKCGRRVLLERSTFERRVTSLVSRGGESQGIHAERKEALEARLADLKGRWAAHSVPLSMWLELVELEEELGKIEREMQAES